MRREKPKVTRKIEEPKKVIKKGAEFISQPKTGKSRHTLKYGDKN